MTNKADEKLDEILCGLEELFIVENEKRFKTIKESIRILQSLKSDNREKWLGFSNTLILNKELDAMILNEGE